MNNIILPRMFGQQLNLGHWSTDGLVGLWRFIEAGNLVDESFSANDGTITEAIWSGAGLLFDGDDDTVNCGAGPSIATLENFSFTIWVNIPSSANGKHHQLALKGAGGLSWELRYFHGAANKFIRAFVNCATTNAVSESTYSEFIVVGNGWHQIGMSYAGPGSVIRLYLDGVEVTYQVQTASVGARVSDSTLNLFLGNNFAANRAIGGTLNNAILFNRTLAPSEVQQLYINPDLPMQRNPAWWGTVQVAAPGGIPILRRRRECA